MEISLERFNGFFQTGGWILSHSYSVYPNDSIGTWDWEDGEGDGTPPMMAWRNDTLYSFFIYGLSEEVRNNDKGSYQYDEAHRRLHISGFSFRVFWKNLNDLEVISINEDEMRCKAPLYQLVKDENAIGSFLIFKHIKEDVVNEWYEKCVTKKRNQLIREPIQQNN